MSEQSREHAGDPVAGPWSWIPAPHAWYESLLTPLAAWAPDPALELKADHLRRAIAGGIDRNERWIRHPCLNPITQRVHVNRRERDFQLAVWTAAHAHEDLGTVSLHTATPLWSPAGDEVIEAGIHELAQLGARVRDAQAPVAIALDVWCGSVGYPLDDSWLAVELVPEAEQALKSEILGYCRAIDRLRQCMPETLAWISAATAVIVPMRNPGLDAIRSCSQASIPGLVWTDLIGGAPQILETVVHETAHNHLYVAEADGALVDPDHHTRYASPLRPEPRPLRGILLACHALAYITAAFDDARRSGYFEQPFPRGTYADLVVRRDQATRTLLDNRAHLTDHGRRFFERTLEVCAHAHPAP